MTLFDWLNKADQLEEAVPEAGLKERVIEALRTVYDPEIPVNIFDLGLIYRLDVAEQTGQVAIEMTLTAPGCPVAQSFPATVEGAVAQVAGVKAVTVELVWDPPWSRDRMSDAARLELGMI
jgi:FeS assembly SUF system protein